MRARFLSGNLKGRDATEFSGVNRRIILKWILVKRVGKCGLGSSNSGYEPVMGYGLENRGSTFRFPAGTGNFSFHHRI